MELLEQNISEKQLIINKQIENLTQREHTLASQTLEKAMAMERKEDNLAKRETEVLERE